MLCLFLVFEPIFLSLLRSMSHPFKLLQFVSQSFSICCVFETVSLSLSRLVSSPWLTLAHFGSFWLCLAHSGSLWLSLCFLWLLPPHLVSPCLSLALCDSHSGSHWLSLPLSGLLWPSLAHYCSLISHIQPLIGSQGPCSPMPRWRTLSRSLTILFEKKSVFWLPRKLVFGQQNDFQITGIHLREGRLRC